MRSRPSCATLGRYGDDQPDGARDECIRLSLVHLQPQAPPPCHCAHRSRVCCDGACAAAPQRGRRGLRDRAAASGAVTHRGVSTWAASCKARVNRHKLHHPVRLALLPLCLDAPLLPSRQSPRLIIVACALLTRSCMRAPRARRTAGMAAGAWRPSRGTRPPTAPPAARPRRQTAATGPAAR
jgi:hypothetical protein